MPLRLLTVVLATAVVVLPGGAGIPAGRLSAAAEAAPPQNAAHEIDPSALAENVVTLTNEARARAGLPPLAADHTLAKAAAQYAELMRDVDQIGHAVEGETIARRLAAVGYPWQAMGENVAYISEPDAEMVVRQWMRSAPHRTNILRRTFREIGVGVAGPSRSGRYYFSQMFGARRPSDR